MSRGLLVAVSVITSQIPLGSHFGWDRHAQWYGLEFRDLIFPTFLFLFGAGMALAYRRGVRWRRVARRTVLLFVLGIAFNLITNHSLDPGTIRLTGVLQVFALSGLIVTLAIWRTRSWWSLTALGGVFLAGHGAALSWASQACGGLPQPHCTSSWIVDRAVFGVSHIYVQGSLGHDPEGLASLVGITGTVLLGAAAGRLLVQRAGWARLTVFAAGLAVLTPLASLTIPINKRIWSPSFALATAAVACILLAVFSLLLDLHPDHRGPRLIGRVLWPIEAFGRNALLVYFGKDIVGAILAGIPAGAVTADAALFDWLHGWAPSPYLGYAVLMLVGWFIVVAFLHRMRWYVRV
jgi:predicted acyltransferase